MKLRDFVLLAAVCLLLVCIAMTRWPGSVVPAVGLFFLTMSTVWRARA